MALSRIDAYEPGCALAAANLTINEKRSAILDELVRIRHLGCRVQVLTLPKMREKKEAEPLGAPPKLTWAESPPRP